MTSLSHRALAFSPSLEVDVPCQVPQELHVPLVRTDWNVSHQWAGGWGPAVNMGRERKLGDEGLGRLLSVKSEERLRALVCRAQRCRETFRKHRLKQPLETPVITACPEGQVNL